ncbi:polymorphic toxin-type HINT domain-containing protein [Paenibacillus sp. V4I7]|uniref:polymorphic toxin-type HINT domain-containing protein n=1 Tax=Paenibacillus sp. V4I7 TaxID=3042307 RepID=UPI002788EE25|nr:polymorphic toxin-type HINT domain-containing protein [Paenibacillus sp. V4I7]MDQ0899517.1 RHS repeat-associated protein [Paenibacillus sp. V4I7]
MVTLSRDWATGNIESVTNTAGNVYSYAYDIMDRIKSVIFPFQGSLGAVKINKSNSFSYDKNGNLLAVTDPNAKTWTTVQYNEQDDIKQLNETVTWNGTPFVNSWTFGYDNKSGLLNRVGFPTAQFALMGYDNAERLKDLSFGNSAAVSKSFAYNYDLNGNLTSYGTGASNFTANYDKMNRVTKVAEPTTSNYLENNYDDEGRRTKLRVYNGTLGFDWNYDYTYDNSGKPKKFHDASYNRDSWYLFDEAGRPVKTYNSNTSATFNEYDQEGRTIQLRAEIAGATVDKFRYEYDTGSKITKIWSDMDGSWVEYTYDSLDQLLQEKYSAGTIIEYQYDELGNRTKAIKNGVATTYTYNPEKNRLVSVGSNNYSYDATGNVVGDGSYTYVWGDDNKLKEVKQGSNSVAAFTYDALGNRDTLSTGGITKEYHYDGNFVTYVKESDGKIYRFAYDHNGSPIFMSYQGSQYWYHYDEHGNVIRMTDSNGTTVVQYKYDAWGNITSTTSTNSVIASLNPYRYAGYWYDEATKKYYLNARYYDPQIGRFLSKDPIAIRIGSELSLNAYSYADNNPVMHADPEGKFIVPIIFAAFYAWSLYDSYRSIKQDPSAVNVAINAAGFINPSAKLGSKVTKIARAAKIGKGKAIGACNCFTAGTKVLTDEGEKPIEVIEVGDMVLAKSEYDSNGELAYKEVTALYRNQRDDIIKLYVGEQIIETTDNHPFWVEGKGWVYADELLVGDKLQKADGSNLTIDKVEFVKLDEPVTVYNFTVADYHTYYVTDLGIWVHNTSCGPNGTFVNADYHGATNSGKKNKAPNDGQTALDNSISIGPNTDRRIGISNKEFVVLDKTRDGIYHGHARSWGELDQKMQAIFRKAGLVDKKGNIK